MNNKRGSYGKHWTTHQPSNKERYIDTMDDPMDINVVDHLDNLMALMRESYDNYTTYVVISYRSIYTYDSDSHKAF